MNFKKLKLWKLLAVGGVVGLVATVPIITTACSSATEENNGNTNLENVTDRFVYNDKISQTNPLEIIDSFQNLVNPQNKQETIAITTKLLNDNLSKLINDGNGNELYKKKLIVNYEKIKDKIGQITIDSEIQSDEKWGTDDQWVSNNPAETTIYYHFNREPLSISSVHNLKEQLTKDLSNIINDSLDETGKNTYKDYTFAFAETSALLIEKSKDNTYDDFLRMHVKAKSNTTAGSNQEKDIELRLPVSDINYVPKNVTISITAKEGTSRNTIQNLEKKPSFVKFNVGINGDYELTHDTNSEINADNPSSDKLSTIIDAQNIGNLNDKGLGTVTAENLSKQLGWYKETTNKKELSKKTNVSIIDNSKIDDRKVAESLHMFNVDFTEISIDGNNDSSVVDYKGAFKLTLKGKPKDGYYWSDKKDNSEKTISFNDFTINLADAKVDREKASFKKTVDSNSNNTTWSYETNLTDLPSDSSGLDQWLQTNKNKLEDEIKERINQKQDSSNPIVRENVAVKYEILPFTPQELKLKQYYLNEPSQANLLQLKCKVSLLPGHKLKEPKNEQQINGLGEFVFTISKKTTPLVGSGY